jgi:hypothetical protein
MHRAKLEGSGTGAPTGVGAVNAASWVGLIKVTSPSRKVSTGSFPFLEYGASNWNFTYEVLAKFMITMLGGVLVTFTSLPLNCQFPSVWEAVSVESAVS